MPEPIKVTLELRGEKYEGLLTDADGLLFMSALMNPQETALLDKGRMEEAGQLLKARFEHRRQELIRQGKKDEDIVVEISTTMLHKVERDPEERSRIAARIKERFSTIPDSLVRWEGKSNYAINLHLEELMQLIVGIIGPALQQFETFKPKKEIEATPEVETEAETEDNTIESESNIAKVAAEIVELEARIEKLKNKALSEK